MDIEQALKIMPIEQAIELNNRRFFCNADETISTIAEWAMRKQIPKKPIKDRRYAKELCPCCNDFVRLYAGTPMLFCCNCGQALDWGEGE